MKEYKVISQTDRWFSGKFSPEKLEGILNDYAKKGWIVVSIATADIPVMMSAAREELIVVMERDVP